MVVSVQLHLVLIDGHKKAFTDGDIDLDLDSYISNTSKLFVIRVLF